MSNSSIAPPSNPSHNASLFLGMPTSNSAPAQLSLGQPPAPNAAPQLPFPQNPLFGNIAALMNPAMLAAMQQQLSNASSSVPIGATLSGPGHSAALGPKPVGALPNDEDLLVNALFVACQKGVNYAQALTELHTVGLLYPVVVLCL